METFGYRYDVKPWVLAKHPAELHLECLPESLMRELYPDFVTSGPEPEALKVLFDTLTKVQEVYAVNNRAGNSSKHPVNAALKSFRLAATALCPLLPSKMTDFDLPAADRNRVNFLLLADQQIYTSELFTKSKYLMYELMQKAREKESEQVSEWCVIYVSYLIRVDTAIAHQFFTPEEITSVRKAFAELVATLTVPPAFTFLGGAAISKGYAEQAAKNPPLRIAFSPKTS